MQHVIYDSCNFATIAILANDVGNDLNVIDIDKDDSNNAPFQVTVTLIALIQNSVVYRNRPAWPEKLQKILLDDDLCNVSEGHMHFTLVKTLHDDIIVRCRIHYLPYRIWIIGVVEHSAQFLVGGAVDNVPVVKHRLLIELIVIVEHREVPFLIIIAPQFTHAVKEIPSYLYRLV